jgi:N-acetyl-gamma-glutamyl-phosphate reductase
VQVCGSAYGGEPFVDVLTRPPGVRDVRETNICAINVQVDPRTGKVLAFGAIDNLWKGTSSQALQSLNLMFGFDETEGLL